MKIGDVAKRAGASVRSIRYYEKVGLINAERGDNGYRDFAAADVLTVRRIGRMIRLGFTTAEISAFLNCIVDDPSAVSACSKVASAHREKIAEIERQIADLEARREKLLVTLNAASGQDDPTLTETHHARIRATTSFPDPLHAGAGRLFRRRR